MATRFVHLAVDSADIALLGRFWSDLLGWQIGYEAADEVYLSAAEHGMGIAFVPVPEPKTVKNRVHLDLASSSAEHQNELVTRALDLGARRADIGQGDVPWLVLADPEGNEFCVLEPRARYAAAGPVAAMVMDCAEPAAITAFWSAAMGWPVFWWDDDGASLRPPGPALPWLELVRVADPKRGKNRIHPDIAPFAGLDHGTEVTRLLELGARPADVGQDDVPWAVLADPEGNEFCVLTPR